MLRYLLAPRARVVLDRSARSGSPHRLFRGRLLPMALAAVGAFAVTALAHENSGAVQEDGRFTPNVDGAMFPPQPKEIANVRQYDPAPEEGGSLTDLVDEPIRMMNRARSLSASRAADSGVTRFDAARAALTDGAVRRALGERFSIIDSARVRDKSGLVKDRFRVSFFSQDNNRTVAVIYADGRIESIDTEAASNDQPPLGEMEMTRAIELAREHWETEGVSRVNDLKGYAIQTFESDGSPYENRVAYVSFHTESPEPPEFVTWVDLTNEQVLRAEVSQ